MPDKLELWLISSALYRKAVGVFGGQAPPERLPDQAAFANGMVLHRVEELGQLPDPNRMEAAPAAFLDARYAEVSAAAKSGWRTVWFNPQGGMAPEAMPVQDVDLLELSQLSQIGPASNKPTLRQCLDWWAAWEVPENIRRHSRAVSQSAYHLGIMLRNKGIPLDPILTQRGGLLHDIDKISTLKESGAHGKRGADFLEAQGYPDLAEIVRLHIMSTILHPNADARAWEVKLVYFCDKLVEGEQLVPFDQRLAALFERYPAYRETMGQAAGAVRRLSDQICSILSIPSHENLISTLIELQNN